MNKLSSTKTQLPYDYYFLKYCKPSKILNNAENLGEVLRGDRIENSVYEVSISYLFPIFIELHLHSVLPFCFYFHLCGSKFMISFPV